MGRKKSFIDKKNSSTYHLLHRSQRDVAGDVVLEEGDLDRAGMVLWPAAEINKAETNRAVLGGGSTTMREWRQRLSDAGLLDDEDHERYLKPITGTGTFFDASGRVADAAVDPRAQAMIEEEALLEVNRQFDSIPLSAECMDDDIAAALLDDFEEGNYEELNDDFVLDAAKEVPDDGGDGEKEDFDFDEHIRRLMEKARLERTEKLQQGPARHDWGQKDNAFFSKLKPLHENNYLDGDSILDGTMSTAPTPGVVAALNPDEERALCEKFEETLAEYDSDEVGDCPEEEIHGTLPLEDAKVETALDDFLYEKEDEIFMQGTRHYLASNKTGGSGFSVLVGKQMVHAREVEGLGGANEEEPEPVEEVLATAREALAKPPLEPPPEEILIDGQSYFSEKVRNPFDCESILSTYSNLDNNPVTIDPRRRRKKKNNRSVAPMEEPVQQIQLSNKTGLPLGAFPQRNYDDDEVEDTLVSVNKGEARNIKETAAEKKSRKACVKKERQMARLQKKVTREVFREEFEKRSVNVLTDDVAGKTVFRYS